MEPIIGSAAASCAQRTALGIALIANEIVLVIGEPHPDDMADHLAMLGVETHPPRDAITTGEKAGDDIPF